jgi:hypothetical protein
MSNFETGYLNLLKVLYPHITLKNNWSVWRYSFKVVGMGTLNGYTLLREHIQLIFTNRNHPSVFKTYYFPHLSMIKAQIKLRWRKEIQLGNVGIFVGAMDAR